VVHSLGSPKSPDFIPPDSCLCAPHEGRGVHRSEVGSAVFCRPANLLVYRIRICVGDEVGSHMPLIGATKGFVQFESNLLKPSAFATYHQV
jgi:hypothetical protein